LQVLGQKAEVYGEPRAVPADAVVPYEAIEAVGIEIIATPGHAPHHICFKHGTTLYLGEAAGTFSSLGGGTAAPEYYLRPATPPKFYPKVALASLDRLLAASDHCQRLVFAHHGSYTGNVRELLANARWQMELWLAVAQEALVDSGLDAASATTAQWHQLREDIAEILLVKDPFYARRQQLPLDIQKREQDFTHQTLRGILGYLSIQ
jgi:hypothetical protein